MGCRHPKRNSQQRATPAVSRDSAILGEWVVKRSFVSKCGLRMAEYTVLQDKEVGCGVGRRK